MEGDLSQLGGKTCCSLYVDKEHEEPISVVASPRFQVFTVPAWSCQASYSLAISSLFGTPSR